MTCFPCHFCVQNKEKERMKAREKETKERESRYSNGHLFTSLSVSATTLCSACNKSITAKEALSCPSESRSSRHTDTRLTHITLVALLTSDPSDASSVTA